MHLKKTERSKCIVLLTEHMKYLNTQRLSTQEVQPPNPNRRARTRVTVSAADRYATAKGVSGHKVPLRVKG